MKRLIDKKVSRHMLIMCFLAYLVVSVARLCVPTVISSMVSENFLDKSQSGLLAGIFYLVYGVFQLIFGKYYNTHAPYSGVKMALFGSAVCCLLMSLTKNFYLLLLFWSLCAVFNASFFPAIMKLVAAMLRGRDSVWANRNLMLAYHIGNVVSLLAGSIIIEYSNWVNLYYFSAAICFICFLLWLSVEAAAKKLVSDSPAAQVTESKEDKTETVKIPILKYFGTGIFCLFGVGFFNALFTGVRSWAPTIIMETYKTSSSFSVFLNVIVVASNVLFLLIMGKFPPKDKLKALILFFSISIPITILMNFTGILNEYIFVIMLALITSVSTYSTNVTAVQIPYHFLRYNDVARICGIMNMVSSFGLLVGNFAYGSLAEIFGWQIILILCVVFVLLNLILIIFALPRFNKFIKTSY